MRFFFLITCFGASTKPPRSIHTFAIWPKLATNILLVFARLVKRSGVVLFTTAALYRHELPVTSSATLKRIYNSNVHRECQNIWSSAGTCTCGWADRTAVRSWSVRYTAPRHAPWPQQFRNICCLLLHHMSLLRMDVNIWARWRSCSLMVCSLLCFVDFPHVASICTTVVVQCSGLFWRMRLLQHQLSLIEWPAYCWRTSSTVRNLHLHGCGRVGYYVDGVI